MMKNNKNYPIFKYLTADEAEVDPQAFGLIAKEINNFEGFLESYKKQVKESGISSIIE